MTTGYQRYDYAWQTPGWSVQDPVVRVGVTDGYIDPGLPSDVSLVRVFGSFREWNSGRHLEGVVQFRIKDILTYVPTGEQIMPGLYRRRFRRDGFSLYLPATDDPQLTPNGFKYEARLTVRGTTQEFSFSLPSTPAEVNVTSLIPVS